jgi:GNAT superfamily N-acetyltransferase
MYQRFLGARARISEKDLQYLTDLDFRRRGALAATQVEDCEERIVGVARYMTGPGNPEGRPELGIVVEDAHQHRGIGSLLLRHLLQVASAGGVEELEAHILAENRRVVAFLAHLPAEVERETSDAVTSVVFRVDDALKAAWGG